MTESVQIFSLAHLKTGMALKLWQLVPNTMWPIPHGSYVGIPERSINILNKLFTKRLLVFATFKVAAFDS